MPVPAPSSVADGGIALESWRCAMVGPRGQSHLHDGHLLLRLLFFSDSDDKRIG